MRNREYYRPLSHEDFLWAMKDEVRLNDEMTYALLERVEDLIEETAELHLAVEAYEIQLRKQGA